MPANDIFAAQICALRPEEREFTDTGSRHGRQSGALLT
jgi:hypothetical protein